MNLQDITTRLNDWAEQTKEYFSQLNQAEQYAWGAEALGFALLVTGIVLLI